MFNGFALREGDPSAACTFCGDGQAPNVEIAYGPASAFACVLCLSRWVDAITGWRMSVNVVQSLAVGDASERFRAGLPPRPGNGAADRAKRWRQARKSARGAPQSFGGAAQLVEPE